MKTPRAICVPAGLMLSSLAAQPGASPEDSPAHPPVVHPQANADERGRLLAVGRKLFVERCSRCHGERGEKPLSTGLPLSQRKLMPKQLARRVKAACRILQKSNAGRCSFTSRVSSTRSHGSEHRTEAQLCPELR